MPDRPKKRSQGENTMTTTTRSSGERRAEAERLHALLIDQVHQLATSEQWARFLQMAASFHQYSFNNLMLILAQNPNATHVAGYRHWQTLGGQVRKGEHGIRIYATATHTRHTPTKDDDQPHQSPEAGNREADDGEDARLVRYYPLVSVFDISQTEPIEDTSISDPVQQLVGDDDHGITHPLITHLTGLGWTIATQPLTGTRNGYTDPATHRVVIRDSLAPAQHAKTLLHETAHILLGHTDHPAQYQQHRGRMETEAESVAYVTAALTGLDTAPYSVGYITGWTHGDTTVLRTTATQVLTTVHHIANILQPTP
jgi:antirestriction protein ArdC